MAASPDPEAFELYVNRNAVQHRVLFSLKSSILSSADFREQKDSLLLQFGVLFVCLCFAVVVSFVSLLKGVVSF